MKDDIYEDIIVMVHRRLEWLGTDMASTPPMNFDDAIEATVFRYARRAHRIGQSGGTLEEAMRVHREGEDDRPSATHTGA